MSETYGSRLAPLSRSIRLRGCSLRTCQGSLFQTDSDDGTQTFEQWVTWLRQDSLARRKSARLTGGSGCSSWPTSTARDHKGGKQNREGADALDHTATNWPTPHGIGNQGETGNVGGGSEFSVSVERMFENWHTPDLMPDAPNTGSNCKNRVPGLGNQSELWATPRSDKTTSEDPEVWEKRKAAGDVSTPPLTMQSEMWATPNAMVANDGDGAETWDARREKVKATGKNGNGMGEQLTIQCQRLWPTTNVGDAQRGVQEPDGRRDLLLRTEIENFPSFHPVQPTLELGKEFVRERRRLNPLFVEWLMGWPIGLTGSGPAETEFCLWRQRMRSALFTLISRSSK